MTSDDLTIENNTDVQNFDGNNSETQEGVHHWFDLEVQPLGRLFDIEGSEDDRYRSLLERVHLNFAKNGKYTKKRSLVMKLNWLMVSGIIFISMKINFLSWNMRGSNSLEKLHTVKRLVMKLKPTIVGLQETKRSSLDITVARELWGSNVHNFIFLPSNGASAGLALLWDLDLMEGHKVTKGKYSVSLFLSVVGSGSR